MYIYIYMHLPTTLEAFAFPFSDAADSPGRSVAAAILVMLIELVFVARIASGRSSCASEPKIFCLRESFSETA